MPKDITIQKSNAERKTYVVAGAILSCSQGSRPSRLKMPFSHGFFVKGKPQMNIMDFVPTANINPFGMCSSLKNPTVASATAANNGVLTPMPCVPLTTMPWIDGKADTLVDGFPALLNKSTNMCIHCGLIKIENDGQDLGGVTIASGSVPPNIVPAVGAVSSASEQPISVPNLVPSVGTVSSKRSMLENLIKGISMLGDVPANVGKAAGELPSALNKAANELPRGLDVAKRDLPKGLESFVKEGYIDPLKEDLNTLQDGQLTFADAGALGGITLSVLTVGRSKQIANLVDAAHNVNKRKNEVKELFRTGNSSERVPIDPAKFERMKKQFERQGGVILQSPEVTARLEKNQAEASNIGPEIIMHRENPTTSAVFEEFIHSTQARTGRATGNNWLEMEIEAQEKLIKYRKAYGIPNNETRQTIKALREYRRGLSEK